MVKAKLLSDLFPDSIVRAAVSKVMKNNVKHVETMSTNYEFLDEDKNSVYTSMSQMCFGSLHENWTAVTCNYNPMYLRYKPMYSSKVNKENRLRWLELGQEMCIMPDDVTPKELLDNGITINMLSDGLTMSELYLKLTYIRWLRESAVLVNNVITLVDEGGRDFWAAVTYCHDTGCGRIDHSLLPFADGYAAGGSGHTNNINRNLGLVIKLQQVALLPRLADKRLVKDIITNNKKPFAWQWQSKTITPDRNLILKDRLMLLSSEVYPMISCGDIDQAITLSNKLKKLNSNVKFE